MVVWLASYPRSGNTYLRLLLRQLYGVNTYSLYDDTELVEQTEICELIGHQSQPDTIEEMMRAPDIYFVKTHELPTENDNSPAIYLVRDGRDVLMSYAHYIQIYAPQHTAFWKIDFENTLRDLIKNDGFFGGWGRHVSAWIQRLAPTVFLLFDDLISSPTPEELVYQAILSLGIHWPAPSSSVQIPSFIELHRLMPQFFRQGTLSGANEGKFSPELHELFWHIHGAALLEIMTILMKPANRLIINDPTRRDALLQTLLHGLYSVAQYSEHRLQALAQENILKEAELRHLMIAQQSFIYFCEHYYIRPWLKRQLPDAWQARLRTWRKQFQPTFGILRQYSPCPLHLQKNCRTPRLTIKNDLPVVSIVTPSLNQSQFIARAIRSVLEQEYPCLEYFVQDGASSDGSLDILEQYCSQLTRLESCEDTGQANAINRGFRHATGDIMAWLNSDDILFSDALMEVVNFFLTHPEVDVVYGHRIIIDEDDLEVGRWVLPPYDDEALRWVDYVPQETLFWRKQIWEKAGAYIDESFDFALDWELLLRFQAVGAKFVRLPRFLSAFRVHARQKTSLKFEIQERQELSRLREQIHKRHVSHEEANFHIRSFMRKQALYQWMFRLSRKKS